MTQFAINFKRRHIDWCHNEIGRLYDLCMAYPNDKDFNKWHNRVKSLYNSANKARAELDAIGISHN